MDDLDGIVLELEEAWAIHSLTPTGMVVNPALVRLLLTKRQRRRLRGKAKAARRKAINRG